MKEVRLLQTRRLPQVIRDIPLVGWCFLLIIFGYALNETWPFFSSVPRDWECWDGKHYIVSHQWIWKGFTDLVLQALKSAAICLLVMRYVPKVSWFFYVMFWYSIINLFLYWYNLNQWPYFFYAMWIGLVVAAARLWPRKPLRIVK